MYPKSKIYRLNEIASIYIYVFGKKGISPLEEGRLIFRVQIVGPRHRLENSPGIRAKTNFAAEPNSEFDLIELFSFFFWNWGSPFAFWAALFFRRLPISNFAIRFLWDFRVSPKAQTKQEPLMQRRFPIIVVYYLKIIRFLGGCVFFSRKFYVFEGFFLNEETVVGREYIIWLKNMSKEGRSRNKQTLYT